MSTDPYRTPAEAPSPRLLEVNVSMIIRFSVWPTDLESFGKRTGPARISEFRINLEDVQKSDDNDGRKKLIEHVASLVRDSLKDWRP